MGLAESLYKKYSLKRVFFSAYLPVNSDSCLPALDVRPPLLREHRLYQADWLLRYYDFSAWELLTEEEPNFDPYLDPKCTWAVRTRNFPRGDQHCAQGGPAAYSGYRAQKCIAILLRPPPAAPWNGRTQADGGCAETCPVLYYLQRPRRSPRNPAGNRRGRCWTPRHLPWVRSSFRWMTLPRRFCRMRAPLCRNWPQRGCPPAAPMR